jgi:NitT/TauT family transport system permease protein
MSNTTVPRPELFHEVATDTRDVIAAPVTGWNRLYAIGALRKTVLLIGLALLWEVYARWLGNPLLFPTFSATVTALLAGIVSGELPRAAVYTVSLLLKGYLAGLVIAAILTALARISLSR